MLVSCDSCEARYDYPDNKLQGRGAKFRCSRCGATVVVFPADHVAIARENEPTTEDWSSQPPLPSHSLHTRNGPPPVKNNSLLDGLPINPPGTVPPVQRGVAPQLGMEPVFAPPMGESALSVTPPPPRAIRQPHHPVSDFVREAADNGTIPPPMVDASVRLRPPPRSDSTSPTGGTSDRFTHGGTPVRETPAPAPVAYSPPTIPPHYQSVSTASGAPNRTGPTDGGPPPRTTYGSPYPQQAGHTEGTTPIGASPPLGGAHPPMGTVPPMGSVPPWQAYGYPTWTHNPDPRQQFPSPYAPYGFDPSTGIPAPTHPGAPTHTGAPALQRPVLGYGPVHDDGQPQGWAWMPVNNGLDRRALVSIIAAALVIGFVGSCAGIVTGRAMDVFTASSVNQPYVPPPSQVHVETPAPAGQHAVRNGTQRSSTTFQVEQ